MATIGKTIMDTINLARTAFKADSSRSTQETKTQLDEVGKNFMEYQHRIELLSKRLLQSETLRRYIQVWLFHAEKFAYTSATLDDNEYVRLRNELQSFIKQSKFDYFSNAFYQVNYDKVPELHQSIAGFRNRIDRIDADISRTQQGQVSGIKYLWQSNIQPDVISVTRDAHDLENAATNIYENVINELQQASHLN